MTPWIEAMRLRTLPVSVAGVTLAWGYALGAHSFRPVPAVLCLIFALLAQIASNFANEYYDYRAGLDRAGREGPRRGVTEGDITPRAMRRATYATLGAACVAGLCLIPYGGWQLLIAGVIIAIGALAYSTGPYPLSRHGLGEVAVLIFFGIVPVTLTYYVQAGTIPPYVIAGSVAIGLMGANVLLVNNYRDIDDDRAVGKHTLTTYIGRPATAALYLADGLIAVILLIPTAMRCKSLVLGSLIIPLPLLPLLLYLILHLRLTALLRTRTGAALNPILGKTALAMSLTALLLTLFLAL